MGRKGHPPKFREKALHLAEKIGVYAAAEQMKITPPTIYQWARDGYKSFVVPGTYTLEFRKRALKLAEKEGIPTAAKELGVSASSIYLWSKKYKFSLHSAPGRNTAYSRKFKEKAVALAKEHGVSEARRRLKLPNTISLYAWARVRGVDVSQKCIVRRSKYHYPLGFRKEAVKQAVKKGPLYVAKKYEIPYTVMVVRWARQLGVELPGRKNGQS